MFNLIPGRCSWSYPVLLSNALLFGEGPRRQCLQKNLQSVVEGGRQPTPHLPGAWGLWDPFHQRHVRAPAGRGLGLEGTASRQRAWRARRLDGGYPSPTALRRPSSNLLFTYTHTLSHTHTHVHTRAQACMHTRMCTCPHAHTYTLIQMCILVHMPTCTHTHRLTHTCLATAGRLGLCRLEGLGTEAGRLSPAPSPS